MNYLDDKQLSLTAEQIFRATVVRECASYRVNPRQIDMIRHTDLLFGDVVVRLTLQLLERTEEEVVADYSEIYSTWWDHLKGTVCPSFWKWLRLPAHTTRRPIYTQRVRRCPHISIPPGKIGHDVCIKWLEFQDQDGE